jgi:RNA polymerase sigma-70 factor (ECF subfamily)
MLESTLRPLGLDSHASTRRRAVPTAAPDALPDLLLIERARGSDETAIEALIRRYGRRLFRVARSVLVDEERAEAAVLEAYLAAFGDLSRQEPAGKFAAWLTRLAYNQARALRASGRPGFVPALGPGDATLEPGQSAAAAVESRERREVEQAVVSLPLVFRTVYVLRVLEGVSGIETAAALGLHETTVRTRLYRAHRRLAPEIALRIRALPAVLEPPSQALDRIVRRVLAHRPQGSMLAMSACAP